MSLVCVEGYIFQHFFGVGVHCSRQCGNGETVCCKERQMITTTTRMIKNTLFGPSFFFFPPTADNVTAVVLVSVPYVQQQVGAVGVGPVSQLGAGHLVLPPLTVPVEVQLPHTADNAERGQRLEACVICLSEFDYRQLFVSEKD